MISLKQTVIVEGKYDKIKLGSFISSPIVETNGFRIFSDREKREMLRMLAKTCGLVILTDSDAAGFKIRNHIKSFIKEGEVVNAFIPQIKGKERRKIAPSAEGTLGVEGMSEEIILRALESAGVTGRTGEPPRDSVTKQDFYADGLIGAPGSAELRARLAAEVGLPEYISTNGLLEILGNVMSRERYAAVIERLKNSAADE